jgi:hypothetical protein
MPKIGCVCGHWIDLTPIPPQGGDKYYLVGESQWDELLEELADDLRPGGQVDEHGIRAVLNDSLSALMPSRAYRCSCCRRLLVFWDGGETAEFFVPGQ